VKYLKGLSDFEYAKVDTMKMVHEISKGMAYLHKQGVLHGDLKVSSLPDHKLDRATINAISGGEHTRRR
jgi:hypothetical protein